MPVSCNNITDLNGPCVSAGTFSEYRENEEYVLLYEKVGAIEGGLLVDKRYVQETNHVGETHVEVLCFYAKNNTKVFIRSFW